MTTYPAFRLLSRHGVLAAQISKLSLHILVGIVGDFRDKVEDALAGLALVSVGSCTCIQVTCCYDS